MSSSKSTTYYAVAKGHNPGIYDNWATTNENVKGFSGCLYEGFKTIIEAQAYLDNYNTLNPPLPPPTILPLDTLTKEQLSVIDHLLKGDNIFLTGGGGVGKSYLLSVIYTEFPGLKKRLMAIKNPGSVAKLPRIQMCALTGCATLLLGHKAKTLHSWAGIGLGKGSVSELYIKIRRNRKAMSNWLCTDLLIIDEISMMTAELLDKLNEIGKKVRSNKKPFGGIQILFVGDFFQLPPVNKSNEPTMFAFESVAWKEAITSSIELTQIQRQKDEVFQGVLKEARTGTLTKESCEILRGCQGRDWKENKIRPTLLFPRRAEVEMINDSNLRALTGRRYSYKARLVYDGKIPDGFIESDENFQKALNIFDSDGAYSKELELMVDAQVMLIANVDPDSGLVNGSRGVIVGFCPSTELPIVEFVNGVKKSIGHHTWPIEDYEFISRTQIPLKLAYAVTIHKCQGSTLDAALVDIGTGNFEFGQAYVALSRARSLEALYVYDFDPTAFKAHPKVKKFYSELQTKQIGDDDLKLLIAARFEHAVESKEIDIKPVIAESSKPIQAINVIKEDAEASWTVPVSGDSLEKSAIVQVLGTFAKSANWLYDSVPVNWADCLLPCQDKLLELSNALTSKEFLPSKENIWRALELTPLESIKVVILGQDPYPTPGNAHGLAFSVLPDIRPIPASLKNIYKELVSDIGFTAPSHGNLEEWAKRGVMLLNTVLTVEAGAPQSHSKIGWEEVTDQIIRSIAAQNKNVIFVLWGKSAQVKKKLLGLYLDKNGHRVLESAHPSPLSASKGFFGTKPFSKVNGWLTEMGKEPINWQT
uniref:Uracil-DNA glycosylase-like domain-containing protein n=1 Tax=viral metagenome TaxID=1070528 RepID=A0A6C0DUR5_9ZZZZ